MGMDFYAAKNSIFIFTQTVDGFLSTCLLGYIHRGVKVFLFTTDSLETYEHNHAWLEAKKYGLFYWEEIPFSNELPAGERAFLDGVVTDTALYEYICKNSQFNREQYEAEHENVDAHTIVSAGAGTGKTTVMIQRLLFLKHTNPVLSFAEIALITFTNEAAVHMRRKLTERLMDYFKITGQKRYLEWIEESQKLRISTIHSFAKWFLETVGPELGLPSAPSLRSFRFNKQRIIEKLIDQYAIQYPKEYHSISFVPQYLIVNMALDVNSVLENKAINSETIIRHLDFGTDQQQMSNLLHYLMRGLREELDRIKSEQYQWEISDLIRYLDRLPGIPGLIEKIPIHYLLVDEFQDTDIVQVQFLLWLFDQLGCRLFVVGDEKQSIYRFRGADYTAFRQLKQGLQQRGLAVQHKYLVKNYRTTEILLNPMNALFRSWGKRVAKFQFTAEDILMPTKRDNGNSAGLQLFTTQAKLKESLQSLVNTDTALLVRTNQDVQEIIKWCKESDFFCEGATQGNFYRTDPVREFYIMVRALIAPDTDSEFFSLHRSSYGANTLSNYAIFGRHTSEREYLPDLNQEQPDWPRWQEFRKMAIYAPALQILTRIIDEINPARVYAERILRRLQNSSTEQDVALQVREAAVCQTEYELNLDYLMYLIQKHFSDTVLTLPRLEKFLRVHIQTDNEEIPLTASEADRKHRFKCMTVHQAKGLEFDHVVIPITEHLFLSKFRFQVLLQSVQDRLRVGYHIYINSNTYRNDYFEQMSNVENDEIVAEETRLLYVAMTRARKSLHVRLKDSFAPSYVINSWGDLIKGDEYGV